jgi:hypothetical protein
MRQIARQTGGPYADVHDAGAARRFAAQLAAEADQPQPVVERVQVVRLWNSPLLFVAFCVLISLEWFLRRRHQMV